MNSFAERLSWSRRQAGYSSPAQAAEEFGWNENTYKSHDNGFRASERGPRQETVKRYARAFKVDWQWLMTGFGAPATRIVSMAGRIGAGAKIDRDTDQTSQVDIELPFPMEVGLRAFEVTGDSMWPRCEEGDVIVCGPESSSVDDIVGRVVAVQTLDGERFFKRVERGSAPGRYNLESINPSSPPIRDKELEWAARIRAIIPRGEWRILDAVTRTHLANVTKRRKRR